MKKNSVNLYLVFFLIISLLLCGCGNTGSPSLQSRLNDRIRDAENEVYNAYIESLKGRESELTSGSLTIDGITMKIACQIIGEPDENGYPLYIALRGGGTDDKAVAYDQFDVMQNYYNNAISSGIYVVPCCFLACFDEHYRPESFLFYDRIIEDAIAFYNADPNRVYLMGFSSGGDGVYEISPMIADRFAATNMSAGYPHERRLENLYNLPICLQMGENDSAFNRNTTVAEYDALLYEYSDRYNGGFQHETFIHCGGTHNEYWSDLSDDPQRVYTGDQVAVWLRNPSAASAEMKSTGTVTWLNQYIRDPLPSKVVWNTDVSAGLRRSQAFYWLDRDWRMDRARIVASYDTESNSISIEQCDAEEGTLKIYLCSEMVDLNRIVTVNVLGKDYKVKPIKSKQIMKSTMFARGDRNYMFSSEIDVTFSKNVEPSVKSIRTHKDEYERVTGDRFYSWDNEGLFLLSDDLFGLSFDQVCEKTGKKLPEPIKWEWEDENNYNLYWTNSNEENGQSVIFMFQYGKCVKIYSEIEGAIPSSLADDAKEKHGDFSCGGTCRFYLGDNVYGGKSHIQQTYVWYKYENWENMFQSLEL